MPPSLSLPYSLRPATADELVLAVAIDDAATLLFTEAGIVFDLAETHPFVIAEHERWQRAIEAKQLWFACHATDAATPTGFSALARAGDSAYLDQLCVLPEHGRRGVGSLLLETACARCKERGDSELWLTTYAHVPWNQPFYERHGFEVVPEIQCNAALRELLAEQRAVLPFPEQRVAMARKLA